MLLEQCERDRKSTRLNSSHTEIYTLSLHDALPISPALTEPRAAFDRAAPTSPGAAGPACRADAPRAVRARSEEHTSELQSHRDLHSFPTRRSSDLARADRTTRGIRSRRAD